MNDDFSTFFSGKKLYGDDFNSEEINKWFADEADGYADLGARQKDQYRYVYHQLNKQHGFKYINKKIFDEALGFGSAYGDELKPIINNINKITILEPSDAFSDVKKVFGTPCKYITPEPSGNMPFESNKFDLITCFGVMHHIPNVSYVMGECYRCTKRDGVMLLREPIVSMGDWRKHRRGLTKRERGIPLEIMDKIIRDAGFKVKHRSLCIFPLIPKLSNKFGISVYNSYLMTMVDTILSRLFFWNIKYHRTKLIDKFAPASVYYVLEK